MKKNVAILSLLIFFAVGMVAQSTDKQTKECTKTEQKAECSESSDKACTADKAKDTKCCTDKAKAENASCTEEANAQKEACCETTKS
jgi:hypothetical protein